MNGDFEARYERLQQIVKTVTSVSTSVGGVSTADYEDCILLMVDEIHGDWQKCAAVAVLAGLTGAAVALVLEDAVRHHEMPGQSEETGESGLDTGV